ncbi:MAG: response regulator, partial [Gammaproteobacteria bacterium]|nr:response regulator [Gammaproteobacteria bacterium]
MDKQVKILVVDGSRVLRRVMQAALLKHLGSERLRIAVAGTADEALGRLNTERFDLITSALQLPDTHGIELC